MYSYIFHQINAFTQEGQKVIGNPASIAVVDSFPDERVMGHAAKALGSPMTSFVCRTDDARTFHIRHFSPDGNENHVCGHATLAAAECLADMYPQLRQGAMLTFLLNPRYNINPSNSFTTVINGRDIELCMPAISDMSRVDDPDFYDRLSDALGIGRQDIVVPAYYVPRIINYVVEMDQSVLLGMKPDFDKLKALALSAEFPHEGIMATAKSAIPGFDILTRVFLPVIGVDEDIACGSANCSVVPYWAKYRQDEWPAGKDAFTALFPYPPEMHRGLVGGVQRLQLAHNGDEVTVTGQARFEQKVTLSLKYNAAPKGGAPSP